MTAVYLALGSNLGDRLANLRAAVAELEERGIAVTARSAVWETPPVPADQPPFLNAALAAETSLEPNALLRELKAIEHALGRRPGPRWGPRPIDIDILFLGGERIETPELTVPHPRIAERAFVLAPLSDIVRGPLPVLGRSPVELLGSIGLQGATRRAAL
jgi:2-amino-4-hydroxy-6-hydroxymethyldihydropteridine diphosphokinase